MITNRIRNTLLSLQQPLLDPRKRKNLMRNGALAAALFAVFYVIGLFVPEGFDWIHFFQFGRFPGFWLPWTKALVGWMDFPTVFALSMIGLGWRTRKYSHSPLPLVLTLASLPMFWILHLGNYDCLVVLGLMLLPWGVPLALLKPHLAAFAFLANRKWFLAGAIWIILSLLIWGFWPLTQINTIIVNPAWREEWVQDISLFPWGLLVAVPLLWYSRGDEDLLMAAGSLATPHLFPYHFIVLMPSLGRMRLRWMILTWIFTWSPLLANYLGPGAWHFGNFASLCFWCGIYFNRPRAPAAAAPPAGEAGKTLPGTLPS
jgi:hypothetical protein